MLGLILHKFWLCDSFEHGLYQRVLRLDIPLHGESLASAGRSIDYDIAVLPLLQEGFTHFIYLTGFKHLLLPNLLVHHILKVEVPLSVVEIVISVYFKTFLICLHFDCLLMVLFLSE